MFGFVCMCFVLFVSMWLYVCSIWFYVVLYGSNWFYVSLFSSTCLYLVFIVFYLVLFGSTRFYLVLSGSMCFGFAPFASMRYSLGLGGSILLLLVLLASISL